MDLAAGWYRWRASTSEYAADRDQRGAIVVAQAEIAQTELLDLEAQEWKDALSELAEAQGVDIGNYRAVAYLHDLLYTETEAQLGTPLKVVAVRVAPPPSEFCPQYSVKLIGAPLSYIVREPSCLRTVRIEPIEEL